MEEEDITPEDITEGITTIPTRTVIDPATAATVPEETVRSRVLASSLLQPSSFSWLPLR